MKYSRDNAVAALALLAHSNERHESMPVMPEDTSTTDLVRRARIVRSLVKTRAMLQETRNRSAELQEAIERFKQRQAKIVNG